MSKPSIGRIVHYMHYDSEGDEPICTAAIITGMDTANEKVSLTIFAKNGTLGIAAKVPQDEQGKTAWSWHWPEREEN